MRFVSILILAVAAYGQRATVPLRPSERGATAPRTQPAKPAAKQAGATAKTPSQLTYPPLKPIQIPPIDESTLPNGMKLYLLEDHELPIVNGTALIRTGNLFDPPDKIGLATMAGSVMRTGGTKAKTGDALDEQLENIAASVESGIGETSGSVSFSAMKESADEVLSAFHDVLTQPEFRQDKIELIRSQLRSSISRRNDDAHGISQREFTEIVYGKNTPYGWRPEYATVDRVTRADIQAFYQRYYFPANVMLAIRGDFSTGEMKAKIAKLFADWTVKQQPVPPFPPVDNKPSPGVYFAAKNDVTQTFFTVGHLGGVLKDKDYPALEVMADILGGGFRSRLVQRVRTRMGAAYDISAGWGATYDHPGLFEIAGSTKSESTAETLKAVREEIERIRTGDVTDEELKTAKDTALNSLVFAFDTKAKTLGRILTYEYYGYPRDFIYQYQKALGAVTKADVMRVAKEHVNPQDLTIVAVGRQDEISKQLATLGLPVSSIDLKIPEAKPEAAKGDEGSLAAGKQLLARVRQAVGGDEKLLAVKDVVETLDFQLDPSAGGMKVKQVDRWIAPTYFRQESTLPMGKISAYSDGKTGWITTPQGAGPLAGAQLKQVQGDLFRLYFRLLLSDRMPDRTVNSVGDNAVEISDAAGNVAKLIVDEKTSLPERLTYQSVQVAGTPVNVEEHYSDYREVSGIKLPYKVTIVQGGRKFADVTVEEYKINSGLNQADLQRR